MRFTLSNLISAALIVAVTATSLFASAPGAEAATQGSGKPKSQRQKVIDFEEDLVEGLNKRPLDSLSSLSDRGRKRRKQHLYRKRVGFRTETQDTLRELRYAQ
jgi:Ni/Co efflux regulator RcnB